MILTKEQSDSLLEAAKPLIKWMSENCNPHNKAIVETNRVELLSEVTGIPCNEFLKD
jgi:hypothetical protein